MAAENETGEAAALFATWLTPVQALASFGSLTKQRAIRTILIAAGAGQLAVGAETTVHFSNGANETLAYRAVPGRDLESSDAAHDYADFWITGIFVLEDHYGNETRYFNVRFDPDGIRKLVPPPSASALALAETGPPGQPKVHAGGRPPWSGWEDLWTEIARQLYTGDLKPTKQRDIEEAMLTIAEQSEAGPRVAVIRTRARKLWQAINREDEN